MLSIWIFIFIVSLILLVKGSDWFLVGAERIGLAMGIKPFIVGVVIVGIGTSLPELGASFSAIIKGVTEIIPANAVGSNITNIFLVVGISAILGRVIFVTKDLIDIDIPLLTLTTVLLLGVLWDKQVTFYESVILLVMYAVYLSYTFLHTREEKEDPYKEMLPSRAVRRKLISVSKKAIIEKFRMVWKDLFLLIIGGVAIFVGAKYLIDSVIALSEVLAIGIGTISLIAIAFGTSLPELFVAGRAALKRKHEMALGTIFGSNMFNALVVIGLPGLFSNLVVDDKTFAIGIPTMALATFVFIISSISRRIYIWEGFFYVALYVLFIAKIFNLF